MKNTLLKTMVSGAFATAMSISLILPGSASAATTQDINVKDCQSYLEQFFINNGSGFTWNTQVTTVPTTSKPITTKPVTNKPVTPVADNNTAVNEQSSVTKQVVTLVNNERAKAGLKPLTIHAGLTTVAVDKAKDMSKNNYFDHNSPTYGSPFDMMKKYGVSFSYAGENIAKGQKTPAEVMKAWMNSPGHRENIMSANFTQIGVGYYNGYWVQEFIGN